MRGDFVQPDTLEISVLIPTYNYGRYLSQSIDSVLAQTRPPVEIIVADDGSTDNTGAVVNSYRGLVKYRHFEHRGVFSLRQAMLSEMQGSWFLNLDADDWIERDFLERAVALVCKYPADDSLAFIYADREDFGDYQRVVPSPDFQRERFKRGNYIPMNALIRTNVARRIGFDAAFNSGWGDYDFFLTLAKKGYRGERLRGSRVHCRVHAASITQATTHADRKQKLMRQIVAKHKDFFSPDEAEDAINRFSPEAVMRYQIYQQLWAGRYGHLFRLLGQTLRHRPQAVLFIDVIRRRWQACTRLLRSFSGFRHQGNP